MLFRSDAMLTVNELSVVASEFIGDSMDVTPPKIVETGMLPIQKSGPNMKMNIIKGFLLGAALASLVVLLIQLTDDTIQSEEDIQRYLGLVTLAVVPDKKGGTKESSGKGRKKIKDLKKWLIK